MNKKLLIILSIILAAVITISVVLIVLLVNKNQALTEITIEQGTLVGSVSEDATYTMYLGIPYASVNAENRFQAPMPPPIWEGIFEATETAPCLQFMQQNVLGEEDCLKINVYVPSTIERPVPVMVFVHGGGFEVGSGAQFGPQLLLQHDIIFVAFNYRLGPLGFLCLGIEEAPGNAGLKDQVAALQWIKKNIHAFGGDPDNITVFGESAGGMSVSLMLASNMTQGLFEKVIIQSGSSLSNLPFNKEPITAARLLANEFGYDAEDPYDLYEYLSNIPVTELVSKKPAPPSSSFMETDLLFSPCIEKDIPGIEPFITEVPYNSIMYNTRDIPIIIGSNSKEGFLQASWITDEELENMNTQYLLPSNLEFDSDEEAFTESEVIRMFYFGNNRISRSTMNEVIDFFTHMFFEVPALIEAEITSKNNISPVYNYYFDYSGGRNPGGYENITGAGHGDELMYLFNGMNVPYPVEENDQKIIDWMTKLWTNFAKFGDPTPDTADDNPIKWNQNNGDEVELLYIQDELKIATMPNPEAFTMWKNIFEQYRRLEPNY